MNFSRRDFLGFSAMAGAAFALPGCCSRCCCGGKGARSSVQLYSVRGLMKDKAAFADTLKLMADIGYPAVEFAGYGGYSTGTGSSLRARTSDSIRFRPRTSTRRWISCAASAATRPSCRG